MHTNGKNKIIYYYEFGNPCCSRLCHSEPKKTLCQTEINFDKDIKL